MTDAQKYAILDELADLDQAWSVDVLLVSGALLTKYRNLPREEVEAFVQAYYNANGIESNTSGMMWQGEDPPPHGVEGAIWIDTGSPGTIRVFHKGQWLFPWQ